MSQLSFSRFGGRPCDGIYSLIIFAASLMPGEDPRAGTGIFPAQTTKKPPSAGQTVVCESKVDQLSENMSEGFLL